MARFRNPAFQGVSDVLSQIQQTRLQAPMLEGRLRGLVAQARQRNAAASLDEQTYGTRDSARDRLLGAADVLAGGEGGGEGGVDPNALLLGTAGDLVGGGDTGDFGAVLSGITSIPGVGGQLDPRARDNVFVGTGTQDADDTFTGLGDVLANERDIAGMKIAARGGGGAGASAGGGAGFTLSSGGRSFIERNIRRALEGADAEGFEGADGIIADAVAAAERVANERELTENEAINLVLDSLEITPEEVHDTWMPFDRTVTPGNVSLGDLFVVDPGADDPVGGDAVAPAGEDPAPPTEAPAPPSGVAGSGPMPAAIESEAIQAIRRGADPAAVLQRLQEMGYDPRTSTALGQMVR